MGSGADCIRVVTILATGAVISARSAKSFPSKSWNLNMASTSSGPTPVDRVSTNWIVGERTSL